MGEHVSSYRNENCNYCEHFVPFVMYMCVYLKHL